MYQVLRVFLFFVVGVQNLFAQSDFAQMQSALNDSAYIKTYYYLRKTEPLYSTKKPILPLKLSLKATLQEQIGLCKEIAEAHNLGIPLNKYFTFYQKYYCQADKELLGKEVKKMYVQKGQNKANGYTTVYTKDDSLRGGLNPMRTCYDVSHYALDLRINTKKQSISGHITISFTWKSGADAIQIDAHKDLKVDSIVWQGKKWPFRRERNVVYVSTPQNLTVGNSYALRVYYHGKPKHAPNPPWEGGFVWKKNESSKVWAGVACEHLGASFWWPCKDHPSDEPDSMRMSFEVPQPYKVISNGKMVKDSAMADGYSRFTWQLNNPINNYNVTFYIGNFIKQEQDYTDVTGTCRKLRFYIMPHNEEKARRYFGLSKEVLAFYEKAFGPYPFWTDGYALVESPFAGMEHQSAIAIGPDYGKVKSKEARYQYVKDDYLIIHETAHEWWGNSVTANDMADAWLQEGFATYSEYLFIENKYGTHTFLNELSFLRYYVLNYWPMLGNRNVNDNAFIGSDIYNKGALLLQNLRACIDNDSLFFHVIKSYAVQNKHKIVSTEDLISHVRKETGTDYTPLFDAYLKQTEIPTLSYSFSPKEDGGTELSYKWINVPKGFQMPFALKASGGEYIRIMASTEDSSVTFPAGKNINFISANINLKGCPARYYGYYDTFMR